MFHKIFDSRLLAFFIIIVFIIIKIPHLDYSFFWDESYPYASAIHEMYQVGPSLSPSAISPELSRGHPTLFIFLVASWMKIFGTSLVAIHSFPLFISTLLSLSIYEISRRFFNAKTGLIALVLIIFQPLYLVQSSMVLLEIFLAFFALLSLYFYAKNRLIPLSICLLFLFYTKESGLTLGLSLGIVSIIRLLMKDIDFKTFGKHLMAFFFPLLGIVLFFVVQKHQLGWYFFPFHVEIIESNYSVIYGKIKGGFKVLTKEGNRDYIVGALGILIFISLVLNLKVINIDHIRNRVFSLLKERWISQRIFLTSIIIFIPIFLLFSALNYFINRYFIIAFIPCFIVFAFLLEGSIRRIHQVAYLPIFVALIFFHFWNINQLDEVFDDQMGAFPAMKVEQEMIAYLEDNYTYHTPIATNAYLLRIQLSDPKTRYLQSDSIFTDLNFEVLDNTEVVIFSGKEYDYQYDDIAKSPDFILKKRFEIDKAWAEVYERIAYNPDNTY